MCSAPQRRALFRHLNLQKWSEALVFLTSWLRNVLRATTACTFSTSQFPKVVRSMVCFVHSKCASRHNGLQFFISHLARWLRTRRFSEPTFRPSGATNHWKNTVNRDFPTFSRICIFLLTLSPLWPSLFYSSLLCDSSHLYCSSVHIVGSLTSKLPSITNYNQQLDDSPILGGHQSISIGISTPIIASYGYVWHGAYHYMGKGAKTTIGYDVKMGCARCAPNLW